MDAVNKLKADLYRVVPRQISVWSLMQGLRNQGFRYLVFARMRANSKSQIVQFILRFFVRHYMYKFGFQVPVKNIGAGLYLGHFGTIVVSKNATIGRNCNIGHGVTIGATRGPDGGAPTLSDYVWVGTGAVIVGRVSIGTNVVIAPNSFVNFDVPDNSVVVGNPGVTTPKNNPTKQYINNIYDD